MTNHAALIERARRMGSEAEYEAWLRKWPSWLTKTFSYWAHGEGRSVVCHVLRVSAGSGKAFKSPYFAVPMTDLQHQNQHQHGYSWYAPIEVYEKIARQMLELYVSGVQPPSQEELADRDSENFVIEHAGQIKALAEIAEDFFKANDGRMLELEIKPYKNKRSLAQNRAMWKVIHGGIKDVLYDNPKIAFDFLYDYSKAKLLSGKRTEEFIHEACKEMFNDGRSTRVMSVKRFSSFLEKIYAYFLTRHEYKLPEIISPNQFNQGDQ